MNAVLNKGKKGVVHDYGIVGETVFDYLYLCVDVLFFFCFSRFINH